MKAALEEEKKEFDKIKVESERKFSERERVEV